MDVYYEFRRTKGKRPRIICQIYPFDISQTLTQKISQTPTYSYHKHYFMVHTVHIIFTDTLPQRYAASSASLEHRNRRILQKTSDNSTIKQQTLRYIRTKLIYKNYL